MTRLVGRATSSLLPTNLVSLHWRQSHRSGDHPDWRFYLVPRRGYPPREVAQEAAPLHIVFN